MDSLKPIQTANRKDPPARCAAGLFYFSISYEVVPLDSVPAGLKDPDCTRRPIDKYDKYYETCNIGQKGYAVQAKDGRCNGTPYWAIQVPKEFIPDHNTIFTERLLQFLMPFIPTPQRTPYLQMPSPERSYSAGFLGTRRRHAV